MRDTNGETRRERNEAFELLSPEAEVPEAGHALWDWFWDLRSAQAPGFSGPVPLSHQEMLAWLHLTNISIGHWANVEKLLGNILPSHCFLRLEEAGQTMAVGLAVYERGYVGLFDIVTNPAFRRQGWGRRLVVELLRWGQAQGANTAYLQVATPNTAALQLYAGFGFREVYRYWYRVKALAKV